jgi:hypothetical protein
MLGIGFSEILRKQSAEEDVPMLVPRNPQITAARNEDLQRLWDNKILLRRNEGISRGTGEG